jgi:membrane protease subunit HflC
MRYLAAIITFVAIGTFVVLSNAFFIVQETENAIVLQFGDPVGEVALEPGLHFKLPFIQQAVHLDRRIIDLDTPPERVLSSEQRPVLIDTYVRWRIIDPLLFYQRSRTFFQADQTLTNLLRSNLRAIVGEVSFTTLLSPERAVLMERTQQAMNEQAERLGIEVVDVRILRADLPDEIEQTVFRRMRTEREALARETRARGEAEAVRIRARAERERTVTLANARRDSEIIRGEGDAERNSIFADAYGRDTDFFAFYRAMLAYQNSLGSADTRLVLSPDSDFFRYFGDPEGEE